jgi:cytoplasmic iron level regulating protein YaaA (DUF328/UPF0246 family)
VKRICLIACASSKKDTPQPAKDLYISALFQKSVGWMNKQNFDYWFILSAKHGLLPPDIVIAPYNQTLNQMPIKQRKLWADNVFDALKPYLSTDTTVTFLAGNKYREHLANRITNVGCEIQMPVEGMRIGEQLKWLTENS